MVATEERTLTEQDEKLFDALARGGIDDVECAIANGANLNAVKKDLDDDTPILHAIKMQRSLDFCSLLIKSGADLELANKYCLTPIQIAIDRGNCNLLELLINGGVDINTLIRGRETLLKSAIDKRDFLICETLINLGIDLSAVGRNEQVNCLYHLADIPDGSNAHKDAIMATAKLILAKVSDSDMLAFCHGAIFHAIYMNKIDLTEFLMEKIGTVVIMNDHVKTPLMHATQYGRTEICKMLISKGARITPEQLAIIFSEGKMPGRM